MPKSKRESKWYEGVLFKCVDNTDIASVMSEVAGLDGDIGLKITLSLIDQENPDDKFYVKSGGCVCIVSPKEVCDLDYGNKKSHIFERLEDLEGIPVRFQLNAEDQACSLELR